MTGWFKRKIAEVREASFSFLTSSSSRSYRGHSLRRCSSTARVFETLELRAVLTAEGDSFTIDQSIDTSGLIGNLTANATWGDGSTSALTVSSEPATGQLKARIDYSRDTSNFFNTTAKRQLMQYAADLVVSKFNDSLTAILPSGANHWVASFIDPTTDTIFDVPDLRVNANELIIYVGARDLPRNALGEGGPGFAKSFTGTTAWFDTVQYRGQTGASLTQPTDFGPWGGQIAFDSRVNWFFGLDENQMTSAQQDFLSVAAHETLHLLGFGIVPSWRRYATANGFNGPASRAAYDGDGVVPMSSDGGHWREGIADGGEETLMDPSITSGTRKLGTNLDLAGMQDMGWQVITQTAKVTGSHVFGDNATYPVSIELNGSQIGSRRESLSAAITNAIPILNAPVNRNAAVGVQTSIVNIGSFSDDGFDVPLATPPSTERFNYTIDWGDQTPLDKGTATIDRMGSAIATTLGSFDGAHTYESQGSYTVKLTVADDDGGSATQSFTMTVGGPPKIELSIDKSTIAEDDGASAAVLTVRRSGIDTSTASTVALRSSDTSELTVPASVVIPIGATSATVLVTAIDDALLDGLQETVINATLGTLQAAPITVLVSDVEKILLTLANSSVGENAGPIATRMTITRSNTDRSQPLVVSLTTSDRSEAIVEVNAVIPANAASVDVDVQAIDDTLIDGTKVVQFRGTSVGYVSGTVDLNVTDYEPIQLVLASTSLTEAQTNRLTTATLLLPGPAPTGGIVITLNDSNKHLTIPNQVTIPAGQTSVSFPVEAKNDFRVQGNHSTRLTGSNAALISDSVDIVIADDDLPLWLNSDSPFDVNEDLRISPLDALLIINLLNLRGSGELKPGQDAAKPLVDPNGNGVLEPLDALLVINYLNLNGIG